MMGFRKKNNGSVLIVALWAMVFLGALAVSVGTRAAASIRLAEHFKAISSLDNAARAGVDRAVAAVRSGDEDIISGEASEYWSRENAFIEGTVFSVISVVNYPDTSSVTNFGVVCETARTNINSMTQVRSLLNTFTDRVTAGQLEESIRKYRLAKKELTKGLSNGRFESVYELLLVDGVTDELFESIRPYLTVYDKNCFRGVSIASFRREDDDEESVSSAQSVIEFVYDIKRKRIVYWEQ